MKVIYIPCICIKRTSGRKCTHMLTEVILEGGVHRSLLSVFYDFVLLSFKNVCIRMLCVLLLR